MTAKPLAAETLTPMARAWLERFTPESWEGFPGYEPEVATAIRQALATIDAANVEIEIWRQQANLLKLDLNAANEELHKWRTNRNHGICAEELNAEVAQRVEAEDKLDAANAEIERLRVENQGWKTLEDATRATLVRHVPEVQDQFNENPPHSVYQAASNVAAWVPQLRASIDALEEQLRAEVSEPSYAEEELIAKLAATERERDAAVGLQRHHGEKIDQLQGELKWQRETRERNFRETIEEGRQALAAAQREVGELRRTLERHDPPGHNYTNEQYVKMVMRAEAAEARCRDLEAQHEQLRQMVLTQGETIHEQEGQIEALEAALAKVSHR